MDKLPNYIFPKIKFQIIALIGIGLIPEEKIIFLFYLINEIFMMKLENIFYNYTFFYSKSAKNLKITPKINTDILVFIFDDIDILDLS